MTVDRKTVTGRRELSYRSYDDLLSDAEQLAAGNVRTLANWSYPQILVHLGKSLEASIDGVSFQAPWPMRLMGKLFMKSKFLDQAIPPGFDIPENARSQFAPSESISLEEGLDALRRGISRCQQEPERAPHPFFGRLTRDEWDRFNLRHAEMHMSFAVGEDGA